MNVHDILSSALKRPAPQVTPSTMLANIPGWDSVIVVRLMLAIEEAATNVVSYAFAEVPPPHRFRVRLDIDDKRCAAELADNGRPFDPSAAPPPDLTGPIEERDPGGLGIHLIRNMADRVEYRRENGQNRLRIETARR